MISDKYGKCGKTVTFLINMIVYVAQQSHRQSALIRIQVPAVCPFTAIVEQMKHLLNANKIS